MSQYNYKSIQPVPSASSFLDIVLSKTQRKTPTIIHKGYAITRIRHFYMRKVKFTAQTFSEKLGCILADFPRLDDIHPFYSDLMNILYDKDHYKLALGQINAVRHLIETVSKDYLRLLKYGDSLYRCKQLKRAALGRMATLMKRQKESLTYLEQVRQHLARLPSIDPNTRTLLICGYPNAGKSSFVNKVTRAEVDVQPYAFTTKSLFVGHMDYKYLRWQVIDTPGILDHPLEQRNTIEMQSITALAHLRACVLFFIDISEQCGYTIEQQVGLFNSIKPLFANKPLLLVANKIDVTRPEDISASDQALLQTLLDQGVEMMPSSSITDEGLMQVRNAACDKLLAARVEVKMKTQKVNDVLNRLHLTQPTPRDEKARPPCIPENAKTRRRYDLNDMDRPRLARDEEADNGGAGVFIVDLKRNYQLQNDDWKYDAIPEILNGKNIFDFVDPEIDEHLRRLEAEEDLLEQAGTYAPDASLTEEEKQLKKAAKKVKDHKKILLEAHCASRRHTHVIVPAAKLLKKRTRPDRNSIEAESSDVTRRRPGEDCNVSRVRGLSMVRDRSTFGVRSEKDVAKVERIKRNHQKKSNLLARVGEADRHINTAMPKHMFAGKRTSGTHNRR